MTQIDVEQRLEDLTNQIGSQLGGDQEQPNDPLVRAFEQTTLPQTTGRRENVARRRAEEAATPSFGEAVGAAFSTQTSIGILGRALSRRGFDPDPNFVSVFSSDFPEEARRELTDGIDFDLRESLSDAVSLEHAAFISSQMRDVTRKRQLLSRAGAKGGALVIAANVLDPAFIAAGVATGGFGVGFSLASRGARLSRMGRAGMLAAVPEVGVEAVLAGSGPERGVSDVLYAGVGAFALGGAFQGGADAIRAARRVRAEVEANDIVHALGAASADDPRFRRRPLTREEATELLTEAGRRRYADALDPEDLKGVNQRLIDEFGFDGDDADAIRALPLREQFDRLSKDLEVDDFERLLETTEFVGGQKSFPSETLPSGEAGEEVVRDIKRGDLDLSSVSDARSGLAAVRIGRFSLPTRWSIAGRLGQSESDELRFVANAYTPDSLLKRGGAPATDSAALWAHRTAERMRARFMSSFRAEFSQWRGAGRATTRGARRQREEFLEQVSQAIRRPKGEFTRDAHVNAVADRARTELRDALALAQRHGVRGLEDVAGDETYLTRLISAEKSRALVASHGREAVVNMLRGAFLRGSDEITEETAQRLASGYLTRIQRLDSLTDFDKLKGIRGDDVETSADILREALRGEGLSVDAIESAVASAGLVRRGDTVATPRARSRVRADETFVQQLDDGRSIGFEDLLENDAATIFDVYSRQISGAAAEAEVLRVAGIRFGREFGSFDSLQSFVTRRMEEQGVKAVNIRTELARLEHVRKATVGIPLSDPLTTTNLAARRARMFVHNIISGTFGVAQLPEFGNAVAGAGLRATIQQTPSIRRLFRRAVNGELTDELAAELEILASPGVGQMLDDPFLRSSLNEGLSEGARRGDVFLRRSNRLANQLSFMAPITDLQQRWTTRLMAQKMANLAFTGRPLSKFRKRDLGFTDEMSDRVFGQIRKHATRDPQSKALRNFNHNRWEDEEALNSLIFALRREGARLIQRGDVGSMSKWMTSDIGRVVVQYRSFVLQAWEKQFLHRLQARDIQTFAEVSATTLIAAFAYVAQEHARMGGLSKSEKRERAEERLNTGAIVKAAVQRSGYASILPQTFDTLNVWSGGQPLFNFRNSMLTSEALLGNPVTSTIDTAQRAARGAGRAVRGADAFDERDARAARRLIPFQRVVGIENVLNAIERRFPEPEN